MQACDRVFSCNCGFQCNRGYQGPFGFICPQGLQLGPPRLLLQWFQPCVLVSIAETSIEQKQLDFASDASTFVWQYGCSPTSLSGSDFPTLRRDVGGARTDQLHILWECSGTPSLAQRPRKPKTIMVMILLGGKRVLRLSPPLLHWLRIHYAFMTGYRLDRHLPSTPDQNKDTPPNNFLMQGKFQVTKKFEKVINFRITRKARKLTPHEFSAGNESGNHYLKSRKLIPQICFCRRVMFWPPWYFE